MKIVVISPEGDDPREKAIAGALFSAGLSRYHLRKPRWSSAPLASWLAELSEADCRKVIVHSHHDLVATFGLGGRHWPDKEGEPVSGNDSGSGSFTSRSCHDLASLRSALGNTDSVFFGPVFPSISKPGYGPAADFPREELQALLADRSPQERRTSVIAIGGITAERIATCRELGFDGVAVLGAVWQAADPVRAFAELQSAAAAPSARFSPVMCLTLDGQPFSHLEQARRLCDGGARWIQLRMKEVDDRPWLATARAVVEICRARDAVCIVNDRVDIALAAGADGVHLGQRDGEWREARRQLGSGFILGGTVNDTADADRALAANCLDYVGVGPLRFTTSKRQLAPILGLEGVRRLAERLDGLPAWVIGGVEVDDLPALRAAGAAGAAISSALYRQGCIERNVRAFLGAWHPRPTASFKT